MAKNKLTKLQIQEMCDIFSTGKYILKDIAEKFGVSISSAQGVLSRRGYKCNPSLRRKYKLNENFFNQLNEKSSYFLGFLYADGYVSAKRNNVCLSLKEQDEQILLELSKAIETNKPLQYIKKGKRKKDCPMWRINLESKNIKNKLIKLGCVPNKTFLLQFPGQITDDLFPHFLRGYFDGDGCITTDKSFKISKFSIYGTFSFLNSIKTKLTKKIQVNNVKILKHRKSNIYSLAFAAKKDLLNIYDLLYNNSSIQLDRKYEKFKSIIEFIHSQRTKN